MTTSNKKTYQKPQISTFNVHSEGLWLCASPTDIEVDDSKDYDNDEVTQLSRKNSIDWDF